MVVIATASIAARDALMVEASRPWTSRRVHLVRRTAGHRRSAALRLPPRPQRAVALAVRRLERNRASTPRHRLTEISRGGLRASRGSLQPRVAMRLLGRQPNGRGQQKRLRREGENPVPLLAQVVGGSEQRHGHFHAERRHDLTGKWTDQGDVTGHPRRQTGRSASTTRTRPTPSWRTARSASSRSSPSAKAG